MSIYYTNALKEKRPKLLIAIRYICLYFEKDTPPRAQVTLTLSYGRNLYAVTPNDVTFRYTNNVQNVQRVARFLTQKRSCEVGRGIPDPPSVKTNAQERQGTVRESKKMLSRRRQDTHCGEKQHYCVFLSQRDTDFYQLCVALCCVIVSKS